MGAGSRRPDRGNQVSADVHPHVHEFDGPGCHGTTLRKSTAVISNEERNLLLHDNTTTADFSPDNTGFEMTWMESFAGGTIAVRHSITSGYCLKVVPWTLPRIIIFLNQGPSR